MIDPAELLDIGKERWTCYKFSVTFDYAGVVQGGFDLRQDTIKQEFV